MSFTALPPELLCAIADYLDCESLLAMRETCVSFAVLFDDNLIWYHHYVRRWPVLRVDYTRHAQTSCDDTAECERRQHYPYRLRIARPYVPTVPWRRLVMRRQLRENASLHARRLLSLYKAYRRCKTLKYERWWRMQQQFSVARRFQVHGRGDELRRALGRAQQRMQDENGAFVWPAYVDFLTLARMRRAGRTAAEKSSRAALAKACAAYRNLPPLRTPRLLPEQDLHDYFVEKGYI